MSTAAFGAAAPVLTAAAGGPTVAAAASIGGSAAVLGHAPAVEACAPIGQYAPAQTVLTDLARGAVGIADADAAFAVGLTERHARRQQPDGRQQGGACL